MKCYTSIALEALIAQASAYDPLPIAGYLTGTDVLDHGAIDGDQAAMGAAIEAKTKSGFDAGKVIYKEGGNSKSVATLTLSAALTAVIPKNTVVSGVSIGGAVVTATAYAEFPIGSKTIDVKYTPMTCLIGGLDPAGYVDSGCFALSGEVSTGASTLGYSYSLTDNNNKRTLQGFSTAVESKMSKEEIAIAFKDYYGVWDYADQFAQAVFEGEKTDFTLGDADFTGMGFVGKEQIVKKGIAYMHVLLYALHEFESAIGKCNSAVAPVPYPRDPIHAWDEGVAFFVGNLEGIDGSGKGNLVYALGDKRCLDFGTCGASGDQTSGTSQVNLQLIDMFNQGNKELVHYDCDAAEEILYDIKDLMFVPLIQGTLKYAYKGENGGGEKEVAEGTAFAQAVLPIIHRASPSAAATIYNSMKTNADNTVVAKVKKAFESVYEDIGVTCEQVGGLLNKVTGDYYEGMEPCKTKCTDKPQGKKGETNVEGQFVLPSMGLEVECGELGSLNAEAKAFMCATEEGVAACPITCAGDACACMDDKDAKFKYSKNKNKKGTCADVAALGYGKSGNNKRKKFCNKEKNAKTTCPGSCKGWCYFEPPFAVYKGNKSNPTAAPVPKPTTRSPAFKPVSDDD